MAPWNLLRVGLFLVCATVVSRSAFAQIDLTGEWSALYHEDQPIRIRVGPQISDWSGLPLNDAARFWAKTWTASTLSVPERLCIPRMATYSFFATASALRISKETDPVSGTVIALKVAGTFGRADRTIWLDGRPHPSELARHTWAGFATGTWSGNMLTVITTHIKRGDIQGNGALTSDRATVTDHYVRHGNYLTIITVVDDPVYLEEPFIRSANFVLNLAQQLGGSYYCSPFDVTNVVAQPRGWVPHFLPGTNPDLAEFHLKNGLPPEAANGGSASLYPEFMQTLHDRMPAARKALAEWNAHHLDAAKAKELRVKAAAGETRERLGEDYGISIGTVYSVIANEIFPETKTAASRSVK